MRAKNEYIYNDPAIQDLIFAVNNSKRRKLTREVSLSETRDAEKKLLGMTEDERFVSDTNVVLYTTAFINSF